MFGVSEPDFSVSFNPTYNLLLDFASMIEYVSASVRIESPNPLGNGRGNLAPTIRYAIYCKSHFQQPRI